MRLIDADKLIEILEKLNLELFEEFKYADSGVTKIISNAQMYIICESVLPRIKQQPTAFDVDKVVEQLEELKEWEDVDGKAYYTMSEKQVINKAIKIVERGGIDE